MAQNILIVDDEQELADLVELYLKNEGFNVYKFYKGLDAVNCINSTDIDLAILDIMMPDMSGYKILEHIRASHNFPVIMLTAKSEEIDKITGLSLGADDYVTKPFTPLELIARVKAQLRRYLRYSNKEIDNNRIEIKGLVLDRESHQCTLNEKVLTLTPLEFSILWEICNNRGKVVSSEELFEKVWGEKYYTNSNNTVMVHIRHIREKMNEIPGKPKYIKTVWGVGYKCD